MSRNILIIGGGPSGVAAALTVHRAGGKPVIVEQAGALGGKAHTFACKATTRCVLCGACIAAAAVDEAAAARIDVRLNSVVAGAVRRNGGFDVHLNSGGTIAADGIVVATGHVNFNPSGLVEYGYGTHPDIITGYEAEERVRAAGSLRRPSDGAAPRSLAFVQCVGSRELQACGNYCSAVCCKYALRFAALARHRDPSCAVTVFVIDAQRGGKDFRPFYQELNEGIAFVHGRPVVTGAGPGGITVKFKNEATGVMERRAFDLVVLSTGIMAAPGNRDLAGMLGLPVDGDGFIRARGRVEVAGTAGRPMGVPDAMRSGAAAALALMREAVHA